MVVLFILLSLATGERIISDWQPSKQYKILYVDGEMTPYDLKDRFAKFNFEEYHDINENFHIFSAMDCQNNTLKPYLTDRDFRDYVENYCIKNHIAIVTFDNKSSLMPGIDENPKTKEWDEVNQWFIKLRGKGINPVLITHKGKYTKDTRGTSGVNDNNDIGIEISRLSSVTNCLECRLKFTKFRSYIDNAALPSYYYLSYKKDNEGNSKWIGRNTTDKIISKSILLDINDGIRQKVIAEKYDMGEWKISRIKTDAKKKGYFNGENKLTEIGKTYVNDVEEKYNEEDKPYLLR